MSEENNETAPESMHQPQSEETNDARKAEKEKSMHYCGLNPLLQTRCFVFFFSWHSVEADRKRPHNEEEKVGGGGGQTNRLDCRVYEEIFEIGGGGTVVLVCESIVCACIRSDC